MSIIARVWLLPIPLFVVIGACGRVEAERDKGSTTTQAASGLAAKQVFGTYERKGEPFAGALASLSAVPAACDPKQAPLVEKGDGAVFATFFTECADPACKVWKTIDLSGYFKIEGGEAKPQLHFTFVGPLPDGFEEVTQSIGVRYTLFLPNGEPLRATVHLPVKEEGRDASFTKKSAAPAAKGEKTDDTLSPAQASRCISAACECAAQPVACAGTWSCASHACVCDEKPTPKQ